MIVYELKDFQPVTHVKKAVFYCPGCNASPDDWNMPSIHCPCAEFAEASGSLTMVQVACYLAKYAPIEMP